MGGQALRVTVDTNVLLRGIVRDNVAQADVAAKLIREASVVAITLTTLCEVVWIMRGSYDFNATDVASVLSGIVNTGNVEVNRPAVEAGLALLLAGGDFADGVIAYEGQWLGGEVFVSFDKKAVALLNKRGYETRLLKASRPV